jgi:L-threonylcarbamoyladenylate synthase
MKISLEEAVEYLKRSHPVAIPTETVWGLAARWDDEEGVRAIFSLKGRPLSNPLIIHVSDPCLCTSCVVQAPPRMADLMDAFWPGGLTLVVPVMEQKVSSLIRAGLPTAAFRMPDHPLTLELISKTGPLVAPSANLSGSPSATSPEHIEHDFGVGFPILRSELFCRHGIESTILAWSNGCWRIGRLGAVNIGSLEHVLGYEPPIHRPNNGTPLCPGQLFRHYAPKACLTLCSDGWKDSLSSQYDGVLGFSDRHYHNAAHVVSMGSSISPKEVMHGLYTSLRELDTLSLCSVFVDTRVPSSSEWLPILDRLIHASSNK